MQAWAACGENMVECNIVFKQILTNNCDFYKAVHIGFSFDHMHVNICCGSNLSLV